MQITATPDRHGLQANGDRRHRPGDQRRLQRQPPAFVSNGSGFTAYLFASPDGEAISTAQNADLQNFIVNPAQKGMSRRVDDGFAALAYSGSKPPAKAPSKPIEVQRDWLAWIDVRGMSLVRSSTGDDLRGNQVSATFGLTRKFSLNLIAGAFGGYEYFSYNSDALNSQLKGDGWTLGAYLGWRFAAGLRFDLAVARSEVSFDGVSGTATATFPGHRWLVSGGVTGDYHWQGLDLLPSVKVYGLWEHEDGYTDSLTIVEPDRNFATGRASGGTKLAYPMRWDGGQFTPYVGLYGDYYFTKDDAAQPALASVPLLQGWSARATGGLSFNIGNGASLDLGGEFGGIGSDTHIWTYRAQAHMPF
jgi:hypothetical protein